MRKIICFLFSMLLINTGIVTIADWDPEDGHKMHFPQLPDPDGWDVHATSPMICADDWQCSETGKVKDIHFWGSWLNDEEGILRGFKIWIYDDMPVSSDNPYSKPGKELWYREIREFEIRGPYQGIQGWYWPELNQWIYPDHNKYYQYNIFLESDDWFPQEVGKIYWLAISAEVQGEEEWGWKSSSMHWNDDGCWSFEDEWDWIDLFEPPYDPVKDSYSAMLDVDNELVQGGGTGFENIWFYYPETSWWNMWFYNEPFDNEKMKKIVIDVTIQPIEPGAPAYITFAINWATPDWSTLGNQYPPIPPIENEEKYIERDILYEGPIEEPLDLSFTYYIWDYNPEWVSIDIMGQFVLIDGTIEHTCFKSLDLAFVINGDNEGNPDISIDKKVSNDGGITWNDEVNVEIDDTVRFKISVENTGDIKLNYVKIIDTLPSCLEYANNADPVEPMISGDKLMWIYTFLDVGQKKEIEFDAKAIEPGENINNANVTTLEDAQDDDNATVFVGDIPVPDLSCEGEIRWSSIKPGSTVTDTIFVKNIGDPGSNLKWKVCSYPSTWGSNWNFVPDHGDNLKPADGLKAITVSVDAPNQINQQFSGQIELCNEDDNTDKCVISVSLATPKNKSIEIVLFLFLERLSGRFHEFENLLIQLLRDSLQ